MDDFGRQLIDAFLQILRDGIRSSILMSLSVHEVAIQSVRYGRTNGCHILLRLCFTRALLLVLFRYMIRSINTVGPLISVVIRVRSIPPVLHDDSGHAIQLRIFSRPLQASRQPPNCPLFDLYPLCRLYLGCWEERGGLKCNGPGSKSNVACAYRQRPVNIGAIVQVSQSLSSLRNDLISKKEQVARLCVVRRRM